MHLHTCTARARARMHTHTHMHARTHLMKTLASCPRAHTQGDCTEQQQQPERGEEVKRLMPPSFIMTEAQRKS